MPKSDRVGERGDDSPGTDTGTELAAMVHGVLLCWVAAGHGSLPCEFRRACRRLLCADCLLRPMSEGCDGTRAVERHGDDACDGLYVNTPHAGSGSGSAREKGLSGDCTDQPSPPPPFRGLLRATISPASSLHGRLPLAARFASTPITPSAVGACIRG
jgi:hypothetical protein